jgi:hypothetical protein
VMNSNRQVLEDPLKEDLEDKGSQDLKVFKINLEVGVKKVVSLLEIYLKNLKNSLEEVLLVLRVGLEEAHKEKAMT